ncbi:MAG: DNA replication/repair protein RecF [Bacteroidaceae bacterium]|nr:DNA replication/repair protein RecF [Bacteroidaceae bacterium]
MILQQLSIINFKNIAQADLSFSDNINCFLGNNGMGKSNLLDAIYYLSFCKSFTHVVDSQNIRHGEEFFMLQGVYERNEMPEVLSCGIRRRQKKSFKRNKKEYSRLSDHIGFAPLVMVSPDDITLIQGGSEERRRFIDMVISQWDKPYLDTLIRYNKALEQRNTLLRQEVSDPMLYEIWEEQMAHAATIIYDTRNRFLNEFIPVFNRFYNLISNGNEQVGLSYRSHMSDGNLLQQLADTRNRDLILGYTTKGIHRDDMEMTLDEYPMKRIGSQGQCKTYLIALKLAQYDFLAHNGNTTPILLLDDLFDKLDSERVERIMQLVSSDIFGQIFITDTNREYLDRIVRRTTAQHSLYSVSNGEFTLMP